PVRRRDCAVCPLAFATNTTEDAEIVPVVLTLPKQGEPSTCRLAVAEFPVWAKKPNMIPLTFVIDKAKLARQLPVRFCAGVASRLPVRVQLSQCRCRCHLPSSRLRTRCLTGQRSDPIRLVG